MVAEFERGMIRERTKAGLKAAKARGAKLGRPRAMTDSQIAMVRTMKKDGAYTSTQIAAQLGVSRAALCRCLI